MRILCVGSDVYLPGSYAGTTHLWNIANAFKKLGNEVSILVSKIGNERESEEINKIKIFRMKRGEGKFGSFLLFFKTFFKSLNLIKKENINLVYERARIFGGGACLAAKLKGIKSVLELNDPIADAPVYEGRISKISLIHLIAVLSEKFMFNLADKIVTQHKIMAKRAKKEKISIITNAANPDLLNPKISGKEIRRKYSLGKSTVLLYMGSFCKWHACDKLIKIVPSLNKRIKILMVGGGETFNSCKNLVKKLKIEDRVVFTGKVDYNKITKYIAASDIGVCLVDIGYTPFKKLSYYFSPIKIFEYMAMEKPVIATNIENISKVLDGAGYLVNNEKEFISKVNNLTANSSLRKKLGKNGRKAIIKKYNWEQIAKKTLEGIK